MAKSTIKQVKKMNKEMEVLAKYLEVGDDKAIETIIGSSIITILAVLRYAIKYLMVNETKITKMFLNKKFRKSAAKIARLYTSVFTTYSLIFNEYEIVGKIAMKATAKFKTPDSSDLKEAVIHTTTEVEKMKKDFKLHTKSCKITLLKKGNRI
jgi:hypothetical protein